MSKDPLARYYQKTQNDLKKKRTVKDVKLFLKNKNKKAIIWSKNDIQILPEDRDKGWFELWKVILKYIKRLMLKLHWKRHWNIIEGPLGAVTVEHQSIERLMRTTKKRFFCCKTKVSVLEMCICILSWIHGIEIQLFVNLVHFH